MCETDADSAELGNSAEKKSGHGLTSHIPVQGPISGFN